MTTPLDGEEDEFSELTSANFPRVDLVSRPANGTSGWLVMKQNASAGLLDPATVRDLIAKAEPEPGGKEDTVTLTGSPAAIMRMIHGAPVRKADMSGKAINDLPDSDFAFIESGGKKDDEGKTVPRSLRHFPVHDAAHVRNALSRAPQSPFGDEAMPKIRAAAKRFKIDVAKEAGVENVAKDMMSAAGDAVELDDGIDGMDPTVPLAAPDEMAPGDPTDPGSPAWESIDAATGQKWLSIAARLKNALCVLAEREMTESAVADPDDCENAWDLRDAMCAVDFAIETLAVFAATEQAQAEVCAEMDMIGKALAGFDTAPLGVIEGLAAVKKAGRVLSSANEAAIRGAVESLQKVLASLPEAPVAKEAAMAGDKAADVAKEASPDEMARDTGPVNASGTTGMGAPRETGPGAALPGDGPQQALPGDAPGRQVIKAALKVVVYDRAGRACQADPAAIRTSIAKADGDGADDTLTAVFDQDGDLIGVVPASAIQPVAGAGAPKSSDDGDGDGMQDGPAAAAAPDADDMTPQPPADAGTPAEDVAKTAGGTEDAVTLQDVLKSVTDAQTAFSTQQAALLEAVAKSVAAGNEGLAAELEVLKGRLAVVEEQPAAPKVFANGQVPPAHQLRGQDQGAPVIDVAKAMETRKQFLAADPAEQNRLAAEMNQNAIASLEAIHARR